MLVGERVKLAPHKREYIDKFLKWFNDPEITQYLTIYRPLTLEMEEEWFNTIKDRENNIYLSILLLEENDKLIGNCGIHNIDCKNRCAFCGIAIGEKEYQNQGLGTETMKLLVEYGFNTLNLNRLELSVKDNNIRAIKCYKKVGFIEEGRRREAMFINGRYYDAIIMSILREEWNKI
ncbi:MAG: GNAT family N-acetyltransferase [Promethearchaeota archaeon]